MKNKNTNIFNNTYSIAYTEEVMQQKIKNFTLDEVVITDFMTGEKTIIEVTRNSKEWYEYKVIEVAQKIAFSQSRNPKNKHFEVTDLESYLVEEGFKVLVKFDYNQHKYFEAYLRSCLNKKVCTFFNETEVVKKTDIFTVLEATFTNDDDEEIRCLDIEFDEWSEVDFNLELEDILKDLDFEERFLVVKLLEGYKSAEVARELNTYKEKVRRMLKKVQDKLSYIKEEDKPKASKPRYKSNLKSTTKQSTSDQRNHYNKMRKIWNDNNIDLHKTIIEWSQARLEREKKKEE